ncbi:unnamed protein product [Owenia fusiformis]|uniref:Uncharacterized protein n=1 Tax=Owenia fusiformis TaxID=6347 RepID=A0A8J1TQW9_OWEFU|nr:unnamed protein product [Owenia fusiformis]
MDLFMNKVLLDKDNEKVDIESRLANKVVGLYFSASWCPPCKQFTPLLCKLCTELAQQKVATFEVVFISFDKNEAEMDSYREEQGEWLALPFKDPYIEELKEKYKVTSIPKLVIVKTNGDVITHTGRKDVQDQGVKCVKHWTDMAFISESKSKTITKEQNKEIEDTV